MVGEEVDAVEDLVVEDLAVAVVVEASEAEEEAAADVASEVGHPSRHIT